MDQIRLNQYKYLQIFKPYCSWAQTQAADCGPWSSPCISLESQLRASDSSKYCLSEKKEEKNAEFTVVDCFQQKFDPAVLPLKQQCVVRIAEEGVNLCHHGKLSWPEVRDRYLPKCVTKQGHNLTKRHVFLFDTFLLRPQAFENGLKKYIKHIEGKTYKNILKIIYDCRYVSDSLFHQYSVLQCLGYTIKVTDCLRRSMLRCAFLPHRVCTLQECLMQPLKIPSKWNAILKCRQQLPSMSDSENPDIWFLRLFPASLLNALVLNAMYLLLVHSSLMDNLMSDLSAVAHGYFNAYWTVLEITL
ncbi:piRNA biogenesis protein EXD1 [Manacus vitellinus]|uniref:piRNA biogenesis protein EXD1 n=1 Tax=Manacus vitellinus TaxID=328815 RepID=UPI00115EB3A1|nr:piRNA biogenesis protein EXD1 [Manacus vitellinus]